MIDSLTKRLVSWFIMSREATQVGKDHLLQVAERLFTANGYQAVSIRDIAKASGVTNAAIYYYFINKESLYFEVLAYHVNRLKERMNQVRQGSYSHRDRIVQMIMIYNETMRDCHSPPFLLAHKTENQSNAETQDQRAQYIRILLEPLEEELRIAALHGELVTLPEDSSPASLLLGLFHGLIQYRRTCKGGQIKIKDVEMIVDIFWKGMVKKE